MRSANADRFNHDPDAADYDRDVRNESHPIRAGYDALLTWIAARVPPHAEVVDLGSGTGNLAARIEEPAQLFCVDISENMTAIARDKLAGRPCAFVHADLLECFDQLPVVDAIVSSYAVHHLTPDEKPILFAHIWQHLRPGGLALLGDLMFENAAAEHAICDAHAHAGRHALVDDIRDEYFWHLDAATAELERLGFTVTRQRFSELSWAVAALKPG